VLKPIAVLAVVALGACAQAPATSAIDRLTPCTSDDTPRDAYCGTLAVYENRTTNQGRQINLNIVLLPALRPDPQPDPMFFLAGGPGQGAAKMARSLREAYRQVLTDRDIVLVDQRGTGKSNPLECLDEDDSLKAIAEPESAALDKLKACLAGYDADLRHYTTSIAMDDLDDVRAFLGYERINIYGGSYGTRAGLVYMRQHGDRVRTAVLDGVAPTNMRLPLYFARDVQRALDLLVADCAADAACNAAYPNLGTRLRALIARLEQDPPLVALIHPRTGERGDVRMTARIVTNIFAGALYVPLGASLIPALVARAEAGDFQGVLALSSLVDSGGPRNMSIGMQLSVICSEDAPRFTAEDAAEAAKGSLFGPYTMTLQQQACAFWPRGAVDESYYEPVASAIPTLILSGEVDPVTPPSWGEAIAATLPNAVHLVMAGTGHTAGGTSCGLRIIRNFIAAGTTDNLDTSCAQNAHRPPFFITPAGPDPTAGRAPAAPAPGSAP
jgi:pimeloyl-ACP methyl ester carboxylesterase